MRRDVGPLALAGQMGLTVVVTLLATLLLGIWLDGLLGSRPILTLMFSMIGVAAALYSCYNTVSKAIVRAATPRPPALGHEGESAMAERDSSGATPPEETAPADNIQRAADEPNSGDVTRVGAKPLDTTDDRREDE